MKTSGKTWERTMVFTSIRSCFTVSLAYITVNPSHWGLSFFPSPVAGKHESWYKIYWNKTY